MRGDAMTLSATTHPQPPQHPAGVYGNLPHHTPDVLDESYIESMPPARKLLYILRMRLRTRTTLESEHDHPPHRL
ncbi:MAG: hypothetical protein ACLSAH_14825 [Bilophila wadsworthia]